MPGNRDMLVTIRWVQLDKKTMGTHILMRHVWVEKVSPAVVQIARRPPTSCSLPTAVLHSSSHHSPRVPPPDAKSHKRSQQCTAGVRMHMCFDTTHVAHWDQLRSLATTLSWKEDHIGAFEPCAHVLTLGVVYNQLWNNCTTSFHYTATRWEHSEVEKLVFICQCQCRCTTFLKDLQHQLWHFPENCTPRFGKSLCPICSRPRMLGPFHCCICRDLFFVHTKSDQFLSIGLLDIVASLVSSQSHFPHAKLSRPSAQPFGFFFLKNPRQN